MHPIKRYLLRNGDITSHKKMSEDLQFAKGSLRRIVSLRALIDYPTALAIEEYTNGELRWQDLMEYQGKMWLGQALEPDIAPGGKIMSFSARTEWLRSYILRKRGMRDDKMQRIRNKLTDHTDFNTIKRY